MSSGSVSGQRKQSLARDDFIDLQKNKPIGCVPIGLSRESGPSLILRFKILLTRTAYGTDPIVRKGFERSSGSNPAVRISLRWIVNIATDRTNVFLHFPAFFLVKYRTGAHNIIRVVFFKGPELWLKKAVPGTDPGTAMSVILVSAGGFG